jgi:hypothetical protein
VKIFKALVGGFGVCILFSLGCEESSPTKNTTTSVPTIRDLVGTYQLVHYQVQYTDGTSISELTEGVTLSGTMTISTAGLILQTINYNGTNNNYGATITDIKNDSVMTWTFGQANGQTHYSFNSPNLMLRFDEQSDDVGTYVLNETWRRTSLVVQSKAAKKISGLRKIAGSIR